MIIGISGKSKSGKDTVADFFVNEHRATKIALADPMKRFCKEIFDFTDAQLWGPSEERNKPDARYQNEYAVHGYHESCPKCGAVYITPRENGLLKKEGEPLRNQPCPKGGVHGEHTSNILGPLYLTPRQALQQLGTEWGRDCYKNVWVDYSVRMAKKLMEGVTISVDLEQHGSYQEAAHRVYAAPEGITGYESGPPVAVVISDVRFKNEVEAIKAAGGKLIRVRRPAAGLAGEAGQHASETEQDDIPDAVFDFVIENDTDLADLYLKAQHVFQALLSEEKEEENTEDFSKMLDRIDEIVDSGAGIELVTGGNSTLSDLLRQRALDVESGRIMEYDPAQADIPPFKRKKP